MSTPTVNPFTDRLISNSKQLFDSGDFCLEGDLINLTAGAPGPDRLLKCCEVFEVATKHRMVRAKNISKHTQTNYRHRKERSCDSFLNV